MPQAVEMTPGGAWIKPSGDARVTYVIHEAHIRRLLADGGSIVPDPRDHGAPQPAQAEPSEMDAMRAEIAQLRALLLEKQAMASEEQSNATTLDDGTDHNARAVPDRRPGRKQ